MDKFRMSNDEDEEEEEEQEREFWNAVWESNGFDVSERLMGEIYGVRVIDYKKHAGLSVAGVAILARIGIHKYNMFEGTNLEFHSIEKVNYMCQYQFRTNFITVLAKNPDSGSLVPFQTVVVQGNRHRFNGMKSLYCSVARPKPTPTEIKPGCLQNGPGKECSNTVMGEKPPENAFIDEKRFFKVPDSEILKHDWIRLYMEHAFVRENSDILFPDLSQLVILEVAVGEYKESFSSASPLMARDATFYIKYMTNTSITGPPRIVVVRRILNGNSLTLLYEPSVAASMV